MLQQENEVDIFLFPVLHWAWHCWCREKWDWNVNGGKSDQAGAEILAPLCREIHLQSPLGNPHFLSIEVGSFMKIVLSPWRTFSYPAFFLLQYLSLKNGVQRCEWVHMAEREWGKRTNDEGGVGKYTWSEMAVMQVLAMGPWGAVMQTAGHRPRRWSPEIHKSRANKSCSPS